MKVLTAIGNPNLNNRLKEENFDVIFNDIQYQEAVIEILNKNKKIDVLFLNSLLPGENSFYEFINQILKINQKIKIIIILEKENETIKNFLNSKNIFDIYYNNKIKITELINLIKNNQKNIIKKNNKIKNKIDKKINIKNIIKKIEQKIKNKKTKNENKIINIEGSSGSGKTIFTIIFSLLLKNQKILIIDLDENKNINKILNIENKKNILKEIKYNKNIYILNLNKKICNKKEVEKIIKEKKEKYEKIIIDSSNNYFEDLAKIADLNLFLVEPNLIEINKTKKILEKYNYKLKIKNNKIKIIFNKFNIYSINYYILKNIFNEYFILGKINANNKYNFIINKNLKIIDKKITKEYQKIIKNI